ncbi:MAG TPA: hypothetical protein VNZ45_13185 [Bacteroidia bacterium]|jgi:hypothetical protein|nr:hypothetical protein [Bacteroidia bacterium]
MVASPEQLDSVNWISFTKPIEASFEIQFIEKGKPVVLSSNNCMLTPEMHNEMKKLSKGDKVIVQNVDVKAPDGSSIKFYGPTIFVE